MDSCNEKITKLHLRAFGLSEHTVKELVKGLNAASTSGGLREYLGSDIKASVETRLANQKIKAENRAKLQRVLTWLNGESNVIAVDFLKGLSPEKRVEVLQVQLQELETQEQKLLEDTDKLLAQARRMVANK